MKILRLSILTLTLTLFACTTESAKSGWGIVDEASEGSAKTPDRAEADQPAVLQGDEQPQPFVVHEWGTYTSVQGSNGVELPGMHHEEESLPAFVYGRGQVPEDGPQVKQLEMTPVDVTQKLETPVLYFYSPNEMKVDVTVDFPRGVISQWYPDASSFSPEVGELQDIQNGVMSWSIDVSNEDGELVEVPEDDIWAPSRAVEANTIRVANEYEKFIFYRGLGRFTTPFKVTSDADGIMVRNESQDAVPRVFVMKFDGERGMFEDLGALEPGKSVEFVPTPKEMPRPDYFATARSSLVEALVESGLYEDEAWAMVDTWNRSYFEKPGLRVLYVAPRSWTDELLPIQVDPNPDELVRTLIGRVEVLTHLEEQRLLDQVRETSTPADLMESQQFGRFAEPKLRRLMQLAETEEVRQTCARALESL